MVGRAAINFVDNSGLHASYFFHNDKYVWIQWTAGHDDDKIVYGPLGWASGKCWKESGFSRIDAALPIPGKKNEAYFFSENKYCHIFFNPGSDNNGVVGSVHPLSNWHSLTKAGFNHVDAAMIVPGTTDQAFFFSGNEFCRVSFRVGSSTPDQLLDGPHMIRERWDNLGFRTIDTILPNPTSSERAYVFSGDQGAQISLAPGGDVDIKWGPKPLSQYWPSLHQAGFY